MCSPSCAEICPASAIVKPCMSKSFLAPGVGTTKEPWCPCVLHIAQSRRVKKDEGRVKLAEQEARKGVAAAGNQVCDIPCPVHWPSWRVGGW